MIINYLNLFKNMKKKLIVSGLILASFLMLVGFVAPEFVSAQGTVVGTCDTVGTGGATNNELPKLICRIGLLINSIIPILISLGVVYFIWGVIHYAIARDEEAKAEGRSAMINGLIALLVIVSIWGLVNFMKRFIGIDLTDNTIAVPCIPSPGVDCPQ